MALYGRVRCRCWEDGLCTTPPNPKRLAWINPQTDMPELRDPLDFELGEPGGLQVGQKEAYANERERARAWQAALDSFDEDWHAFDAWRTDCCEHLNMSLVHLPLGNWALIRLLQGKLAESSMSLAPTLSEVLPEGSGGRVEFEDCRAILDEIERLERQTLGDVVVLLDQSSDRELAQCTPGRPAWMMLADGWASLLTSNGVIVMEGTELGQTIDPATAEVKFQAAQLEVEAIDGGLFKLTNTGTGESVSAPVAVPLDGPDGITTHKLLRARSGPARFVVRRRESSADDFAPVFDALRRLCQASIETGNPLIWT